MIFLLILITLIAAYLGLLFLIPRGWLLHEFLHLPLFWYRLWRTPASPFREKRLNYGAHSRQYYLLLQPASSGRRRQAVLIYLHGGGWFLGSPEIFRVNARVFLNEGYTVVLPSVRRIPFFRFPAMHHDLGRFASHLRRELEAEGMSSWPVFAGGMSAGAHLMTHFVFDERLARRSGLPLAGAFFCGGPIDLNYLPASLVRRAMAGRPEQPSFHAANPVNLLRNECPLPILLIHGEHDGMAPLACAESFRRQLSTLGPEMVHWHLLPGGTHLDAVSWGHTDNELRRLILQWLSEQEKKIN